jgi:hypothetical protein
MSYELERLRRLVDEMLTTMDSAQAGAWPIATIVSHLRIGEPAHEIAQLASDFEAHLIVLRMEAYLDGITSGGSATESFLQISPCPVLLIPSEHPTSSRVEPPCHDCKKARRDSHGASLWCSRHLQKYGERHYFHHAPNSLVPEFDANHPKH